MTQYLIALLLCITCVNLVWACPGCQNPTLPIVPTGGVFLDQNQIQWGALLSVTPIWVKHEAGCNDLNRCDEVIPQQKYIHDQLIVPAELRLNLDWGISEVFGISVQLPLRLIHTQIDYELPNGETYQPLDAGIHHRDETLVGIGDMILAVRWATSLWKGWWFVGRLGSSLPIGKTEEDPFKAGDQGDEHQHIQLGTGTFDPFTSLAIARSWQQWQLSFYHQVTYPLYANDKGFQAGIVTLFNTQVTYQLHSRSLLHLGLSWMRQEADRWGGEIQQDGILGRQEILLSFGTTFSLGGPQYRVLLQTPVWREIFMGSESEAGEIIAPISLTVGVQGQF